MQKKIIKSIIILFIIFIIGVFFIGLNKNSIYDTKNLIGQKIANVQLEHFSENRIITEVDLKKNNFTLINFWSSWCSPCRKEHPILLKLNKEKNLQLLGVNFKDKKINALKFLRDLGDPYNVLARDEHAMLLRLNNEKNLKLLGVNFKDKKNNALEFLNNLGDPYDNLARDESGKNSVNFGIYGIPESILINKELMILQKFVGPLSVDDYNNILKIIK